MTAVAGSSTRVVNANVISTTVVEASATIDGGSHLEVYIDAPWEEHVARAMVAFFDLYLRGDQAEAERLANEGNQPRILAPSGISDNVSDSPTGLEETHGSRWRTIAMVVGTLLAIVALLNQIPSLSELWDKVRTANWWWVLLAVVFAFGNKVGYALALMGSVSKRLPLLRSIEALLAAAFSNLAVPGVGSTAVQVRYLQCQGIELAAAVAAGAVLANVANVVVQGALFLVALVPLLTTQSVDTSKLDLNDAAHLVLVVIFLAGVCIAIAYGVPRFRRRTVPPTKRGIDTIRTALRSPR